MSELTKLLDKDTIIFGIFLGVAGPSFIFALIYALTDLVSSLSTDMNGFSGLRIRTLFLVAICSNIYWIRYYNKAFHGQTLRGVMISTMILSLWWFLKYYQDLYA